MNSNELSRMMGKNYDKTNVNLDFDFSVSGSGYRLRPHRDDVTRLFNFLIYLNDIPKKNGGALTIFKIKKEKLKKLTKRFPKFNQLIEVKKFIPSRGNIIFFQSTPNSYHGVSLFRESNNKRRFFIYGSYALSKPVIWKYESFRYLPVIKKTKTFINLKT